MSKIFIDTNILVCALDVNEKEKQSQSRSCLKTVLNGNRGAISMMWAGQIRHWAGDMATDNPCPCSEDRDRDCFIFWPKISVCIATKKSSDQ